MIHTSTYASTPKTRRRDNTPAADYLVTLARVNSMTPTGVCFGNAPRWAEINASIQCTPSVTPVDATLLRTLCQHVSVRDVHNAGLTAPTRPVSRSHAGVVDPAQRRIPVLFSLSLEISRSMTTQFGQFDLGRSITSGALPPYCGTLRPFRLTKFILVGLRYTSELLRQHYKMRLPPENPAR
jgi:hypothetical protein